MATATFASMLAEAGVTVMVGLELVEVQRSGSTLTAVVVSNTTAPTPLPTSHLSATAFVDATYEGDLMAAAGVEFTVGREARSQFGEPFAGRRPLEPGACYGFPTDVDPRVRPGSTDGELLAMVWPGPVAPIGAGDRKVMSYNYRLCLTNATEAAGGARAEIEEPADYSPALFELGRRLMRAHPPKQLSPEVLKIYPVATSADGYKTDVNSAIWPTSTNLVGGSWGYPNGTKRARKAIIAKHISYTKGLMWFLKTDPDVPPALRAEMATWAWCGDEFIDNGHFPTQLYVREGRRMVGAHVLTQNDTAAVRVPGNASIAVAGYAFDVHPVEILPTPTTPANGGGERATVEGCIGPRPPPFEIPYASITPKASQLRNLLVPTALSASHVTFAAIRLELTWMAIGQSAGVAATLAISRGVSVQDVPLTALRELLEAAGQVLAAPPEKAPYAPASRDTSPRLPPLSPRF